MTGSELQKERERAAIRPADLARKLGITRQALASTEGRPVVTLPTAERYVNAIEAIRAEREGRPARHVRLVESVEVRRLDVVTGKVAQGGVKL